jgi:hypothetical protein
MRGAERQVQTAQAACPHMGARQRS